MSYGKYTPKLRKQSCREAFSTAAKCWGLGYLAVMTRPPPHLGVRGLSGGWRSLEGLTTPQSVLGSGEPSRHSGARKASRWAWPERVITDCGRSHKPPPVIPFPVEVSHLLPQPQSSAQAASGPADAGELGLPGPRPAPTGSAPQRLHPRARTPPSYRGPHLRKAQVGFPQDVTFLGATNRPYHVRPDFLSPRCSACREIVTLCSYVLGGVGGKWVVW